MWVYIAPFYCFCFVVKHVYIWYISTFLCNSTCELDEILCLCFYHTLCNTYIHYYLTTCLHCVAMAISPHTCYTCLHAWGNGNKSPLLLTSDHESTHTLGLLVIEFQKNTIDLDWPTYCYMVLIITFDVLHYVSYELQTTYSFSNLSSCVLNLCLLTNYFSSWHLILTCCNKYCNR